MTRKAYALCLLLLAGCASAPRPETVAPTAPEPAVATLEDLTDSAKWEPDIAAFEQADSLVRRMPGGVVFVGSSSIRMWNTLAEDFPDVATINRGFGGSRVRDSLFYADRIVTPYQPDAVVFYAGDNDLAEGRTPQQVCDDFAAFVRKVLAARPQARIGFVAIKPSPSRVALLPRITEANALVRAYAQAEPGVDFLDVFTPMVDAKGTPRPELFLEDRLHMNGSGYAIWTRVVGQWLHAL